ncbi:MAG: RIP metalloprotease RseP [Patescibacteria group bacterium]
MTIITFLIVLAVLIFVHELGHFLSARACGIRVDAFAIGFGSKIISKKIGETVYSLNLIPFGGYVKIFGENPDEESINGPDKGRSFVHKPKWQQILVLASGVLFNFIFAWLLITFAFSSGVPASVDSYPQYRDQMKDQHIAITFINKGSPAEKAGLKAGDEIIAKSVENVQKSIFESKDNGVTIKYRRDGTDSQVTIKAEEGIVEGKYAIGIAMDNVATLKLPIQKAIFESIKFTWYMISATFTGFTDLLSGIFKGTANLSQITGPVGIVGLIGDAAKLGFTYLIMFTAIISINLGVLNFIPFPALDGGRILFVLIEAIIRKAIKPSVANTVNAIGFGLLILLMVVITYRDIAKLFVR